MSRFRSYHLPCLLFAALLLCPPAVGIAQQPGPHIVDASLVGDRIELQQGWLFHLGDEPDFASLTLDDSHWTPVDLNKPLSFYGVPRTASFGWLRLHVHLAAGQPPLMFGALRTLGAYQLFANGRLLATVGNLNRHTLYDRAFLTQFPIPAEALDRTRANGIDLVLALRCALEIPTYGGSSPAAPFLLGHAYLGTPRSLTETGTSYTALNVVPIGINFLPSLLTGLAALALFFAVRIHREYLLLAVFCFCGAVSSLADLFSWLLPYNFAQAALGGFLDTVTFLALLVFLKSLLPKQHPLVFRVLAVPAVLVGVAETLWAGGLLTKAVSSSYTAEFIVYVALVSLLLRSRKQGDQRLRRELELLLFPLALNAATNLVPVTWILLDSFHKVPGRLLSLFLADVHLGPFLVPSNYLAQLTLTLCLLVFLVNRTVRIARERNSAAAEIEAAQSVQKLLLSRSSVQTPGFQVDQVYRPANEVGGDFYLLSPDPQDGSLLVILGDVSGKGLIAAMNVAMILGVLRRETSREPEKVLRGINEALVSQGASGFATACCVHLQPTGEFIVANAGHIAPYVSGREVETPAALPLGLVFDQSYDSVFGRMEPNQKMTLLSDGVPEAKSGRGELYGFERLSAITLESAPAIADAAQNFGQEDDITVVSIMLQR